MSPLIKLLSPNIVTKLRTIVPPVTTCEDLLCRCTVQLSIDLHTDIHEIEQIKVKIAGSLLNSSNPYSSWSDIASPIPNLHKPSDVPVVLRSTGFASLDTLFDGGFYPGNMIQILGPSCSGKTQFILSTAIACAKRGLKVFVMNTNNDISIFRIRRILEHLVAQDNSLSNEKKTEAKLFILSNLFIQPAFDIWSALDLLSRAEELPFKYDVILVDCLHSLIAPYLSHTSDRFTAPVATSVAATATSVSSSVSIQPMIASFYALLRSCAGNEATVMVTNVLEKEKGNNANYANMNTSGNATGNVGVLKQPVGTGAVSSDLFDHSIVLSSNDNSGLLLSTESSFNANIVLRPPQYNNRPSQCELRVVKL